MENMSTSTKAIAWMKAKPGRTQVDASISFGISQGAISSTMSRENKAIFLCEKMPKVTADAFRILEENPAHTWHAVSYKLGIDEGTARSIVLGIKVKAFRDAAAFAESSAHMGDVSDELNAGSRFDYEAGQREMREKCAKMTEMVGGEHAASIALAVRSIPL